MSKQISTIFLAVLTATLIVACGGGGGGGTSSNGASGGGGASSGGTSSGGTSSGGNSSDTMSFYPSQVSLSYASGTSAQFQVSATPGNPNEFAGISPLVIEITDSQGVLQHGAVPSLSQSGTTFTATLQTSSTLAPGSYQGNFQVVACTSASCSAQVPGSPWTVPYSIQVTPGKLSLSGGGGINVTYGSGTATLPLQIQGVGVNWSVTTNQPWLQASVSSGSGSQNIKLTMSSAGLALGTYTSTVTATSTDGQTASANFLMYVVPISTLKVTPLQPTSLISNVGASPTGVSYLLDGLGLTWSISTDASWLQVQTDDLTGDEFALNFNTSSLVAGSYSANATVKSTDGQSVTLPVAITVYGANTPLIELYAGGIGVTAVPVDGPAALARFAAPTALTADSSGNLYLLDNTYAGASLTQFESLRRISTSGGVTTFDILPLNAANGVAVDNAGNVYVSVTGGEIFKITTTGHVLDFATSVTAPNAIAVPGPLAVDSQNNVYVFDKQLFKLQKVAPDGSVQTVAQLGSATATPGSANYSLPTALAVDQSGNILLADAGNFTIKKVTPSGQVSVLAGSSGVSGTTDGTGTTARFHSPSSIVVSAAGDFYVADVNCIRKVSSQGVVTTIAGTPSASLAPFKTGPLPGAPGSVGSLVLRGTSLYFATGTGIGVITNVP